MSSAKSFPSDEITSIKLKSLRISLLRSAALRMIDFVLCELPFSIKLDRLESASRLSGLSSRDFRVHSRAWSSCSSFV